MIMTYRKRYLFQPDPPLCAETAALIVAVKPTRKED
jgi:hypothetical protein